MSILTLAPVDQDPAYYAGRADAYDEHTAGTTIPTLTVRAALIVDLHPDLGYAAGYAERVLEIRRENAATTALIARETALAYMERGLTGAPART